VRSTSRSTSSLSKPLRLGLRPQPRAQARIPMGLPPDDLHSGR